VSNHICQIGQWPTKNSESGWRATMFPFFVCHRPICFKVVGGQPFFQNLVGGQPTILKVVGEQPFFKIWSVTNQFVSKVVGDRPFFKIWLVANHFCLIGR